MAHQNHWLDRLRAFTAVARGHATRTPLILLLLCVLLGEMAVIIWWIVNALRAASPGYWR